MSKRNVPGAASAVIVPERPPTRCVPLVHGDVAARARQQHGGGEARPARRR